MLYVIDLRYNMVLEWMRLSLDHYLVVLAIPKPGKPRDPFLLAHERRFAKVSHWWLRLCDGKSDQATLGIKYPTSGDKEKRIIIKKNAPKFVNRCYPIITPPRRLVGTL